MSTRTGAPFVPLVRNSRPLLPVALRRWNSRRSVCLDRIGILGKSASVWIAVGLLGLPHPILWGVAAFLLHYIPFVGATGGIIAMTLVSLIHFDSVWYAFLPPLAYLLCAAVEGNLATPLFLGRWLILNPIAIILSFLLWSYLWGVAGTLLAVPILATFKIFCDRIDPLKRLGSFLGHP